MYRLQKILARLHALYFPDPRALSLMRIAVALTIIADLCIRCSDLTAHYTDAGIWPSDLNRTFNSRPGSWSLHALSGSAGWVALLFALHFVGALFLLIGYRTQLANLLVWLLYISLDYRNPYILQAGDDLLRLLLFWGLLLPWGAHYSIDARRKPTYSYFLPAGLGYYLLIISVYFFTVCLKSSVEWHAEKSAVYYALSLEQIRLPLFGDLLYHFPGLMRFLTPLVYYMEAAIPLLIFIPNKKGYFRLAAFVLILLLHAGIGLCLYVGLFFVINMVSAIGLLPATAMNFLEKRFIWLQTKKKKLKRTAQWRQVVVTVICVTVIVTSLLINFWRISWFAYEPKPLVRYCANAAGFDQYWGMFSPTILKKDGWYVYYGTDSIGRQYDLRLNQDYVDFTKPAHIVSMYSSDRWRKLAENMQADDYTFLRPLYCKYTLLQWNQRHPEKKMSTLSLYFMEKQNLPNYKTSPVTKKLFCICNDHKF